MENNSNSPELDILPGIEIDENLSAGFGFQGEIPEGLTEQVAAERNNPIQDEPEPEQDFSEPDQEGEPAPDQEGEPAPGEPVKFSLSELLPKEIFIDLIDFGFSHGLTAIPPVKKSGIRPEDLKLDSGNKKTLAKPIDRILKETQTSTKSPWLALGIVVVILYAIKMLMAKMAADERREEREHELKMLQYRQSAPTSEQTVMQQHIEMYQPPEREKQKSNRGRKPGGKNKPKEV